LLEFTTEFFVSRVARNLNAALRPAAIEGRWLSSKMEFRSNEAGRTAPLGIEAGFIQADPISTRSHSVSR
jgi:hypothetical protein